MSKQWCKVGLIYSNELDTIELANQLNGVGKEISNPVYVAYEDGEWLFVFESTTLEHEPSEDELQAVMYASNIIHDKYPGDVLMGTWFAEEYDIDLIYQVEILKGFEAKVQIKDNEGNMKYYHIVYR